MRGAKWLNKSVSIDSIEREISQLAATVDEGEQILEEAQPKHATEARAVFWQTLDVEKALARDRELCALEAQQAALTARAEQALGEASDTGQTREEAAVGQPADASSQPAGMPSQPADTSSQPAGMPSQPADASSQPAVEQPIAGASASDSSSAPVAERKPRVMLIEGATDDECRQIAALCTSLGIRGVFKGPQFYETVKEWTAR